MNRNLPWLVGALMVATVGAEEPWTGRRVHPFKDAATEQMVRDIANEKDPVVRQEAAQVTGRPGPMAEQLSVTGDVTAQLRDADPAVQVAAIRAARPEHAPVVVACLGSDDAGVRIAAAKALGILAGNEARGALATRLAEDGDPLVRRTAAEALAALRSRQELVGFLKDARANRRREAARALGLLAEPALAETLLPLVNDSDAGVARAAVTALGLARNPVAVPVLLERLQSSDDAAATALGRIGDARALPALRHALTVMTWETAPVRAAAIEALGRLGDRQAVARVLEIVTRKVMPPPPGAGEKSFDDEAVRLAGLRYLAVAGDAAAGAKLLVNFEEAPPVTLRPALAETLTRLTGKDYGPVPDEDYRRFSVESRGSPVLEAVPAAGVRER